MAPYYDQDGITIYHGDSLDVVPMLEPESISAVITDPPYGLGFMGTAWDHAVPGVPFWQAFMGAMKPGAHLAAFGGSRTYHRMGVAIEDAGLELRDTLMWLYGQGFPKSHDVSKAIDKAAGALGHESVRFTVAGKTDKNLPNPNVKGYVPPAPATPEAEQWAGWGTALKPAHEPIILARKPLSGTVAANVLAHGTGALNIDASRIGTEQRTNGGMSSLGVMHDDDWKPRDVSSTVTGRWPANVILDEDAAALLDEQSGTSKGTERVGPPGGKTFGGGEMRSEVGRWYGDTGGASRFYYVAKASRAERRRGVPDHIEANHPTVKPLALMRYLITLVTPPGGIVLDPFAGSGTTGVVCAELGIPCVLIEKSEDYLPIIVARIRYAQEQRAQLANQYPLGV